MKFTFNNINIISRVYNHTLHFDSHTHTAVLERGEI
jgi:hypothetical protein